MTMGTTRSARTSPRRRLFAFGLTVALPAMVAVLASQGALAQTRTPSHGHPPARGHKPATVDAGTTAATATGLSATPAAAPTAVGAATSDAGSGVVESKTLDGGTKVFKFSELDIEGRLKSPQLVYFLRRVRAEFSAGDLGHRTFMREMSETRKEPSFE